MRPLSERQARNCEEAREPVCKCRCGGTLYGAKRAGDGGTPLTFFEGLPENDPHYIPSAEKKEQIALAKKEAIRKEREAKSARRYEALANAGWTDRTLFYRDASEE